MAEKIIVAGIVDESITDGAGIRFVLFCQGCPRKCRGCHNPDAIPFEGGVGMTPDEIFNKIISNPLLMGVTLSGGEPFSQARALVPLADKIKAAGINLAAYSGYKYEEIISDSEMLELLKRLDVLVDGEFVLAQKDFTLRFKGSKNQRIIDVQKSLSAGNIVLTDWGK